MNAAATAAADGHDCRAVFVHREGKTRDWLLRCLYKAIAFVLDCGSRVEETNSSVHSVRFESSWRSYLLKTMQVIQLINPQLMGCAWDSPTHKLF